MYPGSFSYNNRMEWQQDNNLGYGYPYFPNQQVATYPTSFAIAHGVPGVSSYLDYDEDQDDEDDTGIYEEDDEYMDASPSQQDHGYIQLSQAQSQAQMHGQPYPAGFGGTMFQEDSRDRPQPNTFPGIQTPQPSGSGDPPPSAARAAELRAKLIAMRSASRTPGVQDKAEQKLGAAPQNDKPAVPERKNSITDVDGLLAEGRAAAEAKAKQNNGVKIFPRTDSFAQDKIQTDSLPKMQATLTQSKSKAAPVSEVQKKVIQVQNSNSGPKDTPQTTKMGQESQMVKKPAVSQQTKEAKQTREAHVDSNGVHQSKIASDESRVVRSRENGNHEPPRHNNRTQINLRDTHADVPGDRPQSSGTQPQQTDISTELERSNGQRLNSVDVTPTETTQKAGERHHITNKPITSSNEIATSTKLSRQERNTDQQLTRMDRQPKNIDICADLSNHELASSQDSVSQTQQQPIDGLPKNAAAYSKYFEDLDEWLEVTGYHDRQYRQNSLRRYRALAELELQRDKIEREAQMEQEEKVYLIRSQSFRTPSVRPTSLARAPSVVSMPPPPLPTPTSTSRAFDALSPAKTDTTPRQTTQAFHTSTKRPLSPTAKPVHGHERADKHIRLDTTTGAQQRPEEHEDRVRRSATHDDMPLSASR
ncbi:hypothetical protein AOQ84DRAFT_170101 [Glonium stellatum]|uniref:Uncharacterized protein n=1 Tax=Glonium stellatum TaxID=574774 RepID=A0A8E2JMK0_9PEZI|nr:hypothetical protein AOQ84DRAFT_170101 [Glonium stellatum]